MNSSIKIALAISSFIVILGCNRKYTPKPREYFRIDFPEKTYKVIQPGYPYQFEIPVYSKINPDRENPDRQNWINVSIPANKAEIHISYYDLPKQKIDANMVLNQLMEEAHTLAYKHTIKADAIGEQVFMNPAKKVYGLIYRIEGNAASPVQFFLTDSAKHFLRGALYISEVPNIDSLKPVIEFLEPDIIRLIETTTWK